MTTASGTITLLLRRWHEGDPSATPELLRLVYADLRRIALARLRGSADSSLSPTELVHECFLRLAGNANPEWANRKHFFAISSRLMRLALIDLAREQSAQKRQPRHLESLSDINEPACAPISADVLALHEALEELNHFDARKAQVLELRFFGGLAIHEIGQTLDVSLATVNRELRAGTAWLRDRLGDRLRHAE